MPTETRTPNGFFVFIGSLLAVLAVIAIFTWSIAAGPKSQDLDSQRAKQRIAAHEKLEAESTALLTGEGWVDKAKGIVHVPVSGVFAATATELKAKKPAPSQVKVEPPLPMPVIDPKSTEPPPAALPSAPQGADTIRFQAPAELKPSAMLETAKSDLTASAAPTRPPLINWNETSKLEK